MLKKKRLEKITSEHYAEILRYCKSRLPGDLQGAEDCTQDVFLLLVQKADTLDLEQNIRGWLYASFQTSQKFVFAENNPSFDF